MKNAMISIGQMIQVSACGFGGGGVGVPVGQLHGVRDAVGLAVVAEALGVGDGLSLGLSVGDGLAVDVNVDEMLGRGGGGLVGGGGGVGV